MRTGPSKWAILAALFVVLVVADQATKFLAVERLTTVFQRTGETGLARVAGFYRHAHLEALATEPVYVWRPMWRWNYVENPGAAWGLFRSFSPGFRNLFFSLVALGAVGFILGFYRRLAEHERFLQIALSFVRGHAPELVIESSAFEDRAFHVHVPAGAIPKDGPSAGVTMVTALTSLLSGRPVRHTVGMTGEVTLQGRVLPIGGVKQKVLAAHRAGLTEVVLPERNRGDLDDVPQEVRDAMNFHFAMTVDEVLGVALEPAPLRQPA